MAVLPFPPASPNPKPSRPRRQRRMHLCLSREEEDMLAELARKKGISRSDYLRLCLKAAHHRGGV